MRRRVIIYFRSDITACLYIIEGLCCFLCNAEHCEVNRHMSCHKKFTQDDIARVYHVFHI